MWGKILTVLFLAFFLPSVVRAGDFYPCENDELVGVDIRPSKYCGKGVVVFATQKEVDLAIKFLEEYIAYTPEEDPFLPENKELLKKIKNFSRIPTEIQMIVSLADAEKEAEGISRLKIKPLEIVGR
ncbi:MAG: hypothetical protein V3574_01020 [Candidatus Moraniibacteriota bacterium]